MTLQELSKRTGIELRKLRYVIDRKVVRGDSIEAATEMQGQPRMFEKETAFAIICAALLMKHGIAAPRITWIIGLLLRR